MATFTPWQTFLDESGHLYPQEKKLPLVERVKLERKRIERWPFRHEEVRQKRFIRLQMETDWDKNNRPYYNIHPHLVDSLSKCSLDSIPAKQLEMPGDFLAVNIRFAEKHPALQMLGALVSITPSKLAVFADLGERQKLTETFNANLVVSLVVDILPDESIVDIFNRVQVMPTPENHPLSRINVPECLLNFFRLAVAMGFLANNDEDRLCRADVLSKDLRAFEDALARNDKDKENIIIERARRRGKIGWNVGTDEMFVGELPVTSAGHTGTGERELSWSHLRTGHPHAVRFGEGKRMVKIKWFRPTRVRPDLPFKQ